MSTKTMRLPPRRVVTPTNKREEREAIQSSAAKESKPITTSETPLPPSSHLLAGYLAHEFLAKGTLFGQTWDSTQAELPRRGTKKRKRASIEAEADAEAEAEAEAGPSEGAEKKIDGERYVAVANLLKADGAHFPGIVNPAQLANFLQL